MDTSVRGGILFVDKPPGITSHDAVARTRKLADTRRVGHAGTLDPMATGLLVLGINGATRLLTYMVGLDKEYEATIRLGGSTPTDDADSPIDELANPARLAEITQQDILAAIELLKGEISQVPSTVSAIKVDGKRAYARVRAGEAVELKARHVTVSTFDVLDVRRSDFLDIDVRVECSTGTYIRALARDVGISLGIGGHLTALRRTRVGPFSVTAASTMETLDVAQALHAPSAVARALFPVVELSALQSLDLSQGKRVELAEGAILGDPGTDGLVAAIAPDDRLVGLVTVKSAIAKSVINFPVEVNTT